MIGIQDVVVNNDDDDDDDVQFSTGKTLWLGKETAKETFVAVHPG